MAWHQERRFVVTDPGGMADFVRRRAGFQYVGSESWFKSRRHTSVLLRRIMSINDEKVEYRARVEVAVSSAMLVTGDHSDAWMEQHNLYLSDRLARALAASPQAETLVFLEMRLQEADYGLVVRKYRLRPDVDSTATFSFADAHKAAAFEAPSWCGQEYGAGSRADPKLETVFPIDQAKHIVTSRHESIVASGSSKDSVEYELRYRANLNAVPAQDAPKRIDQGYFSTDPSAAFRIRFSKDLTPGADAEFGQVAVKGPRIDNRRVEEQGFIPSAVARVLVDSCDSVVEKLRFGVRASDAFWEVDQFLGANEGLVIAECEAPSAEKLASLSIPSFCTDQIGSDEAFNNESLAAHPFSRW